MKLREYKLFSNSVLPLKFGDIVLVPTKVIGDTTGKRVWDGKEIRPVFVISATNSRVVCLCITSKDYVKDWYATVKLDATKTKGYIVCDRVSVIDRIYDFPIWDYSTEDWKRDKNGNVILKHFIANVCDCASGENILIVKSKFKSRNIDIDSLEKKDESLLESKQDENNFKQWLNNDEYANLFIKLRNTFTSPENDYYYWIKNKSSKDLITFIDSIQAQRDAKKTKHEEAVSGAEFLGEEKGYKVYHITTYEASVIMGYGAKWCISMKDNDKYWKDYTSQGIKFYFFIGSNDKYALALYPRVLEVNKKISPKLILKKTNFELFNQEDFQDYSFLDKLPIDLIKEKIVIEKEDLNVDCGTIKLKSGKEGYLVVYNQNPLVIGLESETFPGINFNKISSSLSEWYDKEIPDNLKSILKKENLHSLCCENILDNLEDWMVSTDDKEIAFRLSYFPSVGWNKSCIERQYYYWYWLDNACSDDSYNACTVGGNYGLVGYDYWSDISVVRPTFLIKDNQKEVLDIINGRENESLQESCELEEEIKVNDTLNKDLFNDNDELKEEVNEKLLDIVDSFLDKLNEDKIKINIVDVRLLGSNANYNYTDKSDIDLHIVADIDSLPCEQHVMNQLYDAYKSNYNKKHDIKIKGHDVEIYVEDVKTPANSNGVYSLYTGWIKKPDKTKIPEIDYDEFEKVFQEYEDRYWALMKESDESKLKESNEIKQFIEPTVRNALASANRYRDKYGRLDWALELQARFNLKNWEVLWVLDKCVNKNIIDEYERNDIIEYLKLNESLLTEAKVDIDNFIKK